MSRRLVINPKDEAGYRSHCLHLRAELNTKGMPTKIIADRCVMVLRAIFGNDVKVILWIAARFTGRVWRHFTYQTWWGWQYYIRLRTEDEIQELNDQGIERNLGVDMRKRPDGVDSE